MGYKRKYSKRKYRRSRRGKYGRKYRRSFQRRVRNAVLRTTETKYTDIGFENAQLYHNTGRTGFAFSGPVIFDPWMAGNITAGTGRNQRVGDVIIPRGMKIKIWLANKLDRPNIIYRVICCILPRMYNGAVVSSGSIDLAGAITTGSCGNYLLLPVDKEKGIKVLYDRTFSVERGASNILPSTNKETHKLIKMWIKRKKSRPIKYDGPLPTFGHVNNFFALYVIPYDSYGTLTTDNIASCTTFMRLYYKDP